MGGTNDKDNLIELTVEEHAEAHRKLYEEHGKQQDLVAWKSLSKQIGKEEIWLATSKLGGHGNKNIPKSEEHKKKISNKIKKMHENGHYKECDISKAMMGNTNSKNHKSLEYRKKQSEAMKESWKKRKGNLPD